MTPNGVSIRTTALMCIVVAVSLLLLVYTLAPEVGR